jgi:hypothetical protein
VPFVLNGQTCIVFFKVSQYISEVVVPCSKDSIISTPFLSWPKKQLSSRKATLVGIFSVCLVNVFASAALTALWSQQMKSRFHYLLLIQYY